MAVICDIWAKKLDHYEFNKNIIKLINHILNEQNIYFGDRKQIEFIKKEKELYNIKFIDINILKVQKIKLFFNYFFNLYKIQKIKSDKIFILNSLPIVIFLSKVIFNSKKEIYFFLHGMDRLEQENKGMYKYLKYFFKFRNNKNRYKYIVLGENIKKNLIKIFPNMEEQIFSIDHPYSFEKEYGNKEINEILKLGTVGIISQEKGLNNIFEFIEKNNEKFSFKHIGKSLTKMSEGFKRYFPYRNSFLEKDKFEEEILNLDYILILYPNDSYKLTASGVYFDCIKYNKPLLGLKNQYFGYMFKKYGEIGKLFESIDEIIEYLSQERKILDIDYDIFHKNMKNIKKVLNKNVEKQLKEIIGV